MQRSKDRRETTHTVRQHPLARFMLVPHHIGWHLAHHVDSGVPMRHLPRFHAELRRAGYVTDTLEYASYPALWRRLASGPRP
jgi:fatty acid desaturase